MIGWAGGAAHPGSGGQPLPDDQRADVRFGAKVAESCRALSVRFLLSGSALGGPQDRGGTMVKVDGLWFGMTAGTCS